MRVSYSAVLSMDMPADAKLWSPDSPFLYTADITVLTGGRISSDGKYLGGGTVIDTVHTYFGHRCGKRHFLSHLYIKCIILPRQARDKHRENSKKVPFSAGRSQRAWLMVCLAYCSTKSRTTS